MPVEVIPMFSVPLLSHVEVGRASPHSLSSAGGCLEGVVLQRVLLREQLSITLPDQPAARLRFLPAAHFPNAVCDKIQGGQSLPSLGTPALFYPAIYPQPFILSLHPSAPASSSRGAPFPLSPSPRFPLSLPSSLSTTGGGVASTRGAWPIGGVTLATGARAGRRGFPQAPPLSP